jgi:hypothetical protein
MLAARVNLAPECPGANYPHQIPIPRGQGAKACSYNQKFNAHFVRGKNAYISYTVLDLRSLGPEEMVYSRIIPSATSISSNPKESTTARSQQSGVELQ